jgi:hypothetical protein
MRAEPLFRRALANDETALGPDHPETKSIQDNLSAMLATRTGGI